MEFAVDSNTIRGILHTTKTLNTRAIGTYPGLVLCHGFTGPVARMYEDIQGIVGSELFAEIQDKWVA
ncbi:MAG: hypothetical protein WA118_10090 [Carboxydocellales bacterium]